MFTGIFPFHAIEDNDVFIAQTQGSHGTMGLFDNHNNIFFEPLELTEENNNLPTYDIDPDSHFYNTLSMQFGKKCNYYSVDAFN